MYRKNKAVECLDFPGFYEIPGYPRYAISKDGIVFNKLTCTQLAGSKNPAGYVNVRITDGEKTLTWGLHRLLCYVFKHPSKDITNLVVNHINGIKDDNKLDNLEWVTYQENQEHAGLMGLTNKCAPVSIRKLDTKEVTDFPSMVKCAQYLKVSKDTVNWRVKAGEHRVFNGYQYRLTSDKPWREIKSGTVHDKVQSNSKAILVKFLLSGVVKQFNRITDFAKFFDMGVSTISIWLRRENQPVLPGLVQIKFLDDPNPWRKVEDPYGELQLSTKNKRCVLATNAISGEERFFSSAIECSREMGIKPTALDYRLKTNGTRVFNDGYRYSYFDAE